MAIEDFELPNLFQEYLAQVSTSLLEKPIKDRVNLMKGIISGIQFDSALTGISEADKKYILSFLKGTEEKISKIHVITPKP